MDRGAFREFQVTGKGLEVLGEFGHVEVVGVVVVDAKAATDIDITQHRRRSTRNTRSDTGTRNTRSTDSGGGVSHGSSRRSGRNKSAAALAEYLFG